MQERNVSWTVISAVPLGKAKTLEHERDRAILPIMRCLLGVVRDGVVALCHGSFLFDLNP